MSRALRLTVESLTMLAAIMVASLSLTPPAQAHADLVSSSPEEGDTVSAPPTSITLTFTDDVPAEFATVVLTVGDGPTRTLPVSVPDDPTTVRAAVDGGLPDGTWRVDYRVTSADGHPILGSVGFSVQAGRPSATATASGATTRTASPTPDLAPPSGPDPHSRAAPAASRPGSSSGNLALPAIGGGLTLLLVAVLVLARSRRSRGPAPS